MLANRVRMVLRKAGLYSAKDSDFSGTSANNFRYIGTKEELIVSQADLSAEEQHLESEEEHEE